MIPCALIFNVQASTKRGTNVLPILCLYPLSTAPRCMRPSVHDTKQCVKIQSKPGVLTSRLLKVTQEALPNTFRQRNVIWAFDVHCPNCALHHQGGRVSTLLPLGFLT